MLNFRIELEGIKSIKSNPYEFEAKRFLEGVFENLKEMDISKLMNIETLDFGYKCINNEDCIYVSINKEDPFYIKRYSHKVSQKLFETIKEYVARSYWISDNINSFTLKL